MPRAIHAACCRILAQEVKRVRQGKEGELGQGTTEQLNLWIGQIPLSLIISDRKLFEEACKRYEKFEGKPSAALTVHVERESERDEFAGRSRVQNSEFVYDWSGASVQLEGTSAKFFGVRHEFGLDSLIRILLSAILPRRRGFLIHAATILRGERTFIFTGRSGAGKSTIASLSPPDSVLTDEISLLRLTGDEWHAFGTPFWGEFRAEGKNSHAPIAGVYVIHQATEDRIERVSSREAVLALLPNVMFFSRDPAITGHLLQLLTEFVRQVPCYRLYFQRQSSFWNAVAP